MPFVLSNWRFPSSIEVLFLPSNHFLVDIYIVWQFQSIYRLPPYLECINFKIDEHTLESSRHIFWNKYKGTSEPSEARVYVNVVKQVNQFFKFRNDNSDSRLRSSHEDQSFDRKLDRSREQQI